MRKEEANGVSKSMRGSQGRKRRHEQRHDREGIKGKKSTSSAFVMRVVKVNSPVVGLLKPKYPL